MASTAWENKGEVTEGSMTEACSTCPEQQMAAALTWVEADLWCEPGGTECTSTAANSTWMQERQDYDKRASGIIKTWFGLIYWIDGWMDFNEAEPSVRPSWGVQLSSAWVFIFPWGKIWFAGGPKHKRNIIITKQPNKKMYLFIKSIKLFGMVARLSKRIQGLVQIKCIYCTQRKINPIAFYSGEPMSLPRRKNESPREWVVSTSQERLWPLLLVTNCAIFDLFFFSIFSFFSSKMCHQNNTK